jgi:peptidoglycan DL-endopeptidase CwlO
VRRDDTAVPARPAPRRTTPRRTARLSTLVLAAAALLATSTTVAGPAAAGGATPSPAASPTASPTATPTPVPTLGERAVAEASRHAGQPYRFGAVGPTAFDCSGFTRYVYGRLGKTLPRTTVRQYAALSHVARGARRPGDLIFLRTGSGRIFHVGIYAGADRWWVAPKAGDRVKLQALWTTRYSVARVA